MDIRETVKKTLMETLDLSEEEMDFDKPLTTGLGATSVLMVELLAILENEFDIEIENEEAVGLKTANDVVRFLEEKISAAE